MIRTTTLLAVAALVAVTTAVAIPHAEAAPLRNGMLRNGSDLSIVSPVVRSITLSSGVLLAAQ